MWDVCIIGHVTKDIIRVDGKIEKAIPGGTAYYTSIALASLGLKVAVITKTARSDRQELLAELKSRGITVFWQPSSETSLFEAIYYRENLDVRTQKVWAIADPFSADDLVDIDAKVFHVGPLTDRDLTPGFLSAIANGKHLLSLDAQGLIREITAEGTVCNVNWSEKKRELPSIDILKVDDREAQILTGETDIDRAAIQLSDWGVKETIVTFGSRGSLIYTHGKFYRIRAFAPQQAIDATGCGDTYIAGYLHQRLQGEDFDMDFDKAGQFAARVATRKLEKFGPLTDWEGGRR
ncbi:MAG: PfkB family carbohydrate kinase [Cyanobacteriota bacterium]|nr:PfkB family carbohydrate kinase [Cyanobacteriota bacterium]